MSTLRRVRESEYFDDLSDEFMNVIEDDPSGDHVLLPWSEYERLRSVLDAARWEIRDHDELAAITNQDPCTCPLCLALRALDGEPWDWGKWLDKAHELGKNIPEPCQTCGGCGYLMTDDPRKDEDCLTCHGSGKSWKYKPGTTNEHEPCESCGGTGRKP